MKYNRLRPVELHELIRNLGKRDGLPRTVVLKSYDRFKQRRLIRGRHRGIARENGEVANTMCHGAPSDTYAANRLVHSDIGAAILRYYTLSVKV